MKTLVVYYSRSGVTKGCAQTLAKTIDAELEPITDAARRSGIVGFMRSGYEASLNRLTKIGELKNNPADFDLVIVCTPVWAGKPSSPATTFVKKYQTSIKRLAVLITHGSPNDAYAGAVSFLEAAAGQKSVKSLSIDSGSAKKPGSVALAGFANELNQL